jgi:hypothetical protein
MAKTSDYRIVTFQRQPGLWRANMTPIVQPATITRGEAIRGFVTAEDSKSEEDAVIAANRAIRELDVTISAARPKYPDRKSPLAP